MALSNSERIGKGLELLRSEFLHFVERELQVEYGTRWLDDATLTLWGRTKPSV
ncbi:MAG: hypothetical protein V3W19_10260 [Desulfatiglandales bacterium]